MKATITITLQLVTDFARIFVAGEAEAQPDIKTLFAECREHGEVINHTVMLEEDEMEMARR